MPDPLTDPRFVTIFITDESAFGASGNNIYPVRRFAGFYITAADGLNCPGDDPANPGAKNMWGHWVSYVVPTNGGIPDTSSARSRTAASASRCSSSSRAGRRASPSWSGSTLARALNGSAAYSLRGTFPPPPFRKGDMPAQWGECHAPQGREET